MSSTGVSPPSALGRRERKKGETRRRILAAAARLLVDRPFESITAEDIAEEADVSRATLFNYFPEKSAVVAELGARLTRRFQRLLEAVRERPGSTSDQLARLFEECAIQLETRPALSRAILEEAFARHQHAMDRISRSAEIEAGLTRLLEDGRHRGDVRTDVDLGLLVSIVAGSLTEIQLAWTANPTYPLRTRSAEAGRLLGQLLAPPQAR